MTIDGDGKAKDDATDGNGGGAVWLRPDGRLSGAGFGEGLLALVKGGVAAIGILAGVPPMVGGEYWSAEVLEGCTGG